MLSTAYIAGPMSGFEGANHKAFRAAAAFLLSQGWSVVVPHDINPYPHYGSPCPPGRKGSQEGGTQHREGCYVRADLIVMLSECTDVVMIDGWQGSVGAKAEFATALAVRMPIWRLNRYNELLRMTEEI